MLSLRTPIVRSALLSCRLQNKSSMSSKRQQARHRSTEADAQLQTDRTPQSESLPSSSPHKQCDIESHLSREAKTRTLSTLSKFIFGFSGIPGMVSLHGGLPPPSIFPFKSLKMELKDGQMLDIPAGSKVSLEMAQADNTTSAAHLER